MLGEGKEKRKKNQEEVGGEEIDICEQYERKVQDLKKG